MDRGFNSSKPSPGFVYFKTAATHPADTADFLSFNNNKQSPQQTRFRAPPFSSPQQNKFNPGHTSSPVHFRNSPKNNWNPNRSGNHQQNASRRGSSNYSNSSQSFQNDNWTSSGNSSQGFHNRGRKRNSNGEEKQSIEDYIHPSFFEDPWANLMKNLDQSRIQSKSVNDPKDVAETNKIEVENMKDAEKDCASVNKDKSDEESDSDDSSECSSSSDSSSENET